MSGDRYRTCPKCKAAALKKQEALAKKAHDAYGKVPLQRYHAMEDKAKEVMKNLSETSLREDFEAGMQEDGTLFISYSACCAVCGFTHEHKHEEKIKL